MSGIVVIGAGIVGASLSYHFARAGQNVILLEQANAPAAGATAASFAWIAVRPRESCVESGPGLGEDTIAAVQAAHNIGSKDAYEVIAVRRQICGKIGPTSTQICGTDAADLNLASWEKLNSANLGEKCGKRPQLSPTCGHF